MIETAVQIENLTKDFKTDFWKPTIRALENVSFRVPMGSTYGLIGHNGAGKTTTIKILIGLIRPTSGTATILGHSLSEVSFKRKIGYLPENAYYYDFLKAEEILDFYGRLFSLSQAKRRKKNDELLELVGLNHAKDLRLRQFSKGMLQRIGIAQALV